MKKLFLFALVFVLTISCAVAEVEFHIYDDASTRAVMNGFRTEKLGEYSIVYALSEEVTEEALNDWYYNFVSVNDYNWCMILYLDSDEPFGVYSSNGLVQKNIGFVKDEYNDYSLGDMTADTITYYPGDDGTLKMLDFD